MKAKDIVLRDIGTRKVSHHGGSIGIALPPNLGFRRGDTVMLTEMIDREGKTAGLKITLYNPEKA